MTAENSTMSYDMTTSLMQTTTDVLVDKIPLSFYYFIFAFKLRTFEFKCSASIIHFEIKENTNYIMPS